MKARISIFAASATALALVGSGIATHAAAQKNPKAKPAATNSAAVAVVEIPQSVFEMPARKEEGRDPFFPDSQHPYGVAVVKPQTPKGGTLTLKLNGITAGSTPLAIINGKSLAPGESAEYPAVGGKVKVLVVEIKTDTGIVMVEVNGERRELRMPKGM
jgi:hypothetical protein